MKFIPVGTPALQLLGSAGVAGYTLINGTANIPGLSWTAPNDGQLHRVWIFGELIVISAQTGGVINMNITDPTSVPRSRTIWSGGLGAGFGIPNNGSQCLVAPGQPVTLAQTPQTAGASVLFAELWGY
jgi:hypothetical protein